jgi:hypothetical protein
VAQQRNRAKDKLIAEVATDQGGVVGLDQLRELGVSRWAAARGSNRGTLHRVHRGVYAVGHLALERPAGLRAALLACGDGAVISHGTAAALWGLSDKWPTLVDVTVPVEAGRKIDGIRCRRCRYPHPAEITSHLDVTCTTPARLLVDEAGRLSTNSLRWLVERAAVRKLLDLDDCYRTIDRARGRRGIRPLRAILADWDKDDGSIPDLRSVFEARALPRLIARGLPRPLVNHSLNIEGRTLIPDFLWPEQWLIVETDGRETHETAAAFQRDRERDQHFLAAGYRVSRVTWIQLRDDLDGVVARIADALGGPALHRAVP